ncbi:unnamed protein product [Psylliodes chrysocephalus]|uniref:Uncharacterized protein n=1 Tax=Psylliodes chrysocephalus TaxID=3402493 RepID=A0A9P0CLH2_9CUCU|nr:unnamed protein product [Psylliodes chrysocephala]
MVKSERFATRFCKTSSTKKVLFLDKGIDDNAFQLLDKQSIRHLIPKMSRRLLFKKKFKEFCMTKENTMEVWRKASIPVKTEENIDAGIQKLYKEFQNLGKEKSRNTDKANMKRQIWKGNLVELFDNSRQNVMEITSLSEEDKAFLRAQRENRMSSSMTGVDKVFVSKIRTKCIKEEKNDLSKHYRAIALMNKAVILKDSSSSSSAPSNEAKKTLRSSPRVTSTWDRKQLSIKQASTSFIATAKSLGHDISKLFVSPSTVYRARVANKRKNGKESRGDAF